MSRDISFMQYMRAHGNTPGPTQRPRLTGAISGFAASIPSLLLIFLTGTLENVAQTLGINFWLAIAIDSALITLAGMIYAEIFKRAANDVQGGWLFGAGYGFLLWMLGPTTIWQWITGHPLAVGYPAMGLFGGQILYGLVLGLIFPRIHRLVQTKLYSQF